MTCSTTVVAEQRKRKPRHHCACPVSFPFVQVVAAHYSNGVLLLAEAAAGESRTRLFMLSRCGPGRGSLRAAGCQQSVG